MTKHIGLVIPSYNESVNVIQLIQRISAVFPSASIIIVDDSEEREAMKLKKLLQRRKLMNNKKVVLISRPKKLGRGSAVMRGFNELLKKKYIWYFFELDADLAHNPKECEKFLDAMEKQRADVVIGARYLTGSTIVDWPMKRLLLSKLYNKLINIWLGLSLHDYTNGFRLYNKDAITYLTQIQLNERGFIALSEVAYRLNNRNFKIVEIPITFTDRTYGKSSAGVKEYMSALFGIIRVRILPLKRLAK